MATEKENKPDRSALEQVTDYIQLQITATKLAAIEHLSLILSSSFGILLAVMSIGFAMLFLLGALTLWLARAIGSLPWAMVVTAVIFVLVGMFSYVRREKLITNNLIGVFARIFFAPKDSGEEAER